MDNVRFGIVGLGNMGGHHMRQITAGKPKGATLTAVCDIDPAKRAKAEVEHGIPAFESHQKMFAAGLIDAVLIATPHYDHPPIAIDALGRGLHVLSEKPIAVSVKAARELNEVAARHPKQKFGVMFNQRTNPLYQKMRELIAEGELGEVTRVTWLITDWFRTWTYYASGGWRATWAGEGGGVLINQCPHNLDLMQWITGMMPSRVTAVGAIAKTHPIEVEDDISAILEYPNGAVGHFVTSTGEAPGTNRLEVCGDRGKLVAEHGKLTFVRTRKSVRDVRENSAEAFASIETWTIDVPYGRSGGPEHEVLWQNFVDAVRYDKSMLAPGIEGVRGLELGNAIMMAGLTRTPVELPMDGDAYDAFITEMARKYGGKKSLAEKQAVVDMGASFR